MLSQESRYQLLATLCVNIITVSYGVVIGWPSASLLILHSADTPLPSGPLTVAEASWISSLIALGGLAGNIIFGWLTGKVGRKFILISAAAPMIAGWFLIFVAQNAYYLYAARMLQGFSGGGVYVILPVYVAEIADSRIRGTLGSMFMLSCNFGILLAFVMGHFCSYEIIPLILMAGTGCYLGGVMLLPETPQYLLRTGQMEEAERSLRFYRNLRQETKEQMGLLATELETLRVANAPAVENQVVGDDKPVATADAITWRDFCTPHARKAFIIGVFLLWLKTFAGLYAMVTYAGQIFANAGSSISPTLAPIVIGVIQLAGSYVAIILVDRAGRRILMAISTVGTALSLVALASYLLLRHWGWTLTGLGWIPLFSFSAVLFVGSCGILPMPFVIMAEVMPPNIRAYGSSMGMATLWLFAFLLMKCYSGLVAAFGMHGCFYIFAGCSFAGTLFTLLYLPETRGKSFEEIQRVMEGRRATERRRRSRVAAADVDLEQ